MSHRPTLPAGAHAFASMDATDGSRWSVRLCLAGEEPTRVCKRLSPRFDVQTTAYAWLDAWLAWAEGRTERLEFEYPSGRA